jgi:proline iminopeptidase
MLAEIPNIQCPTLILGGQLDPMLPVECQRDIANALDPRLLSYREFEDCGHGVIPDVPELAIQVLRDFIKNQHKPIAPT